MARVASFLTDVLHCVGFGVSPLRRDGDPGAVLCGISYYKTLITELGSHHCDMHTVCKCTVALTHCYSRVFRSAKYSYP